MWKSRKMVGKCGSQGGWLAEQGKCGSQGRRFESVKVKADGLEMRGSVKTKKMVGR